MGPDIVNMFKNARYAVRRNSGIAKMEPVGRAGGHGWNDRDAGPHLPRKLFDGAYDVRLERRGGLGVGSAIRVTVICLSAKTLMRVRSTSSADSPGKIRQLTTALAD